MRYGYSVSFESDTLPVETVRGEFEAGGGDSSLRQGAREACAQWPKGRKFRSAVIVAERLEAAEATSPGGTLSASTIRGGFYGPVWVGVTS